MVNSDILIDTGWPLISTCTIIMFWVCIIHARWQHMFLCYRLLWKYRMLKESPWIVYSKLLVYLTYTFSHLYSVYWIWDVVYFIIPYSMYCSMYWRLYIVLYSIFYVHVYWMLVYMWPKCLFGILPGHKLLPETCLLLLGLWFTCTVTCCQRFLRYLGSHSFNTILPSSCWCDVASEWSCRIIMARCSLIDSIVVKFLTWAIFWSTYIIMNCLAGEQVVCCRLTLCPFVGQFGFQGHVSLWQLNVVIATSKTPVSYKTWFLEVACTNTDIFRCVSLLHIHVHGHKQGNTQMTSICVLLPLVHDVHLGMANIPRYYPVSGSVPIRYQQTLHRNLIYLAGLADPRLDLQTLLPVCC